MSLMKENRNSFKIAIHCVISRYPKVDFENLFRITHIEGVSRLNIVLSYTFPLQFFSCPSFHPFENTNESSLVALLQPAPIRLDIIMFDICEYHSGSTEDG